jgi:hypothetical protein
VKAGDVALEVVGPTGVLVGEPVTMLVTLTVPLFGGGTTEPVPVEMTVESVVDGQGMVVVKVSVMIVPSVVTVLVPVEVVLLETGVELDVEEVEGTDEVDEVEIGVQFGRVMVPLPQPPEEHSTKQFLAQAASPEELDVCQH